MSSGLAFVLSVIVGVCLGLGGVRPDMQVGGLAGDPGALDPRAEGNL